MEISKRQAEVALEMHITIKELSIQDKLRMRADWVGRHPGVKFVPVDCVIEPASGAGKYYKDITEVNLCSYKGYDGIIVTERNDRVTVMLFNGFNCVMTKGHNTGTFKITTRSNRIQKNTIAGSSLYGERLVGMAYGWMLDALPEDIVKYEVNCMDFGGSIKPYYKINKFNYEPDNLEFVTGGKGGRNNLHRSKWMTLWREDIDKGIEPHQYSFSAYSI